MCDTRNRGVQQEHSLRERIVAEVARLEAMDVGSLVGPWGEADRLKEILKEAL